MTYKKTVVKVIFLAEWLVAVYALLGNTVEILPKGYDVNIPIIKYGFVLLRYFDGWGMEKMILAAGVGAVFYIARKNPVIKNWWLRCFCAFLAVCTVFGQSYMNYNSWDYVFKWWMQTVIALFVMVGYYFIFLYFIALAVTVLQRKTGLMRITTKNKIENFLFESHPFKATLLAALLFHLPYVIAFFPGTMQCDGLEQLWRYFGIIELNDHHPIMSTLLMGKCIDLGKQLFHSSSIGFFIYTGMQSVLQYFGAAYMMWFFKRIKAPVFFRWGVYVCYFLLPLFPMWAITLVKDTLYYIFTMFFVIALANIIYDENTNQKSFFWQYLIFIFSAVGMVLIRNNGIYVVIITGVLLFFLCRAKWKVWMVLGIVCLSSEFYVKEIYLVSHNISPGEIGEALSIPFQQTARYIVEHGDDITPEEKDILEELFDTELSVIGENYNPDISDNVKDLFVAHPTGEQIKSYFSVWIQQFFRHPDTYVQAFLNKIYGYFYPSRRLEQEDIFIFYFNGWEKWEDDHMVLEHLIESVTPRKFFENICLSLCRMPVVGMVFSAGLHVDIFLGCIIYLIAKKKGRQCTVLIPSLCVLLICLASPVNAAVRYVIPIMAVQLVNVAWCIHAVKDEKVV